MMVNTKLSLVQAIDLAETVLRERGADYVYKMITEEGSNACVYFADDGAYSCWVGGVFAKVGVNAQSFFDLGVNCSGVSHLVDEKFEFMPEMDSVTATFLENLQTLQDSGVVYRASLLQALTDTLVDCPDAAPEQRALLQSTLDRLNGNEPLPLDDVPLADLVASSS